MSRRGAPAGRRREGRETTNAPTQTGRGAHKKGTCLVLLRGPPGETRTFNHVTGDRRSSVERPQE
ncbi:hypothetical protein FK535_15740 [Mycolicibacterium sp. 018/SC-01/001]|nr:hypothetical protein FK535_15740 [Mycolicibacterium sp. 018/SC-01/001]